MKPWPTDRDAEDQVLAVELDLDCRAMAPRRQAHAAERAAAGKRGPSARATGRSLPWPVRVAGISAAARRAGLPHSV